jgi:pimeloyl-ACP methyl ester carboxylesterase
MRMILTSLAIVVVLLGGLTAFTVIGARRIERAHPPIGRFVEVDGGHLHLLELGPPDAPKVVLLHGASGNLNDMKIALGDRLAARYRVILVDRPGHGWSDRPDGAADATPARQAVLIHQALERIGVTRAVVVGHSWSGALAAAYALAYPEAVSGLVLISPATHPTEESIGWYAPLLTTPIVGPLFAHIVMLPLGHFLIGPGIRSVFAPQQPPPDYIERAASELVLRPHEITANAEDLAEFKAFLAVQSLRYREILVPTTVITGDKDNTVSHRLHAEVIAAMLPRGTLIVLPGIGHMPHHIAADTIIQAIDERAQAK